MASILGNDGANEGAWRFQLRDRFGKFAEMGGEVSFEIEIPGVQGTVYGTGIFAGNKTPEIAYIDVLDNSRIPRGRYEVPRDRITAIKAILNRDTLVRNPDGSVSARSVEKPDKVELTQDQVDALAQYTDASYWNINKHLREGAPLTGDDVKDLKTILDLIDKSTISQNKILYRGRAIKSQERLDAINALKPGDAITDRGIMSTSASSNRANFYAEMNLDDVLGRVMFEIEARAGQKAFEVPDQYSSYGESESEVLLPPNSRLEVVEILAPVDGIKTIRLRLVDSKAVRPDVSIVKESEESQPEPPTQTLESSRLTSKRAVEIWDSVLNEKGAYEFDEKAAAKELYDLMLQEGVTPEQIAVADPQYREYKKMFPDAEDEEDWAVGVVELIRREWNGSPGDSAMIQAMQPVAKELFDLQNTSEASGRAALESLENSKEYLEFGRPAYEAFLRAAYKNTQKFFEERGIKTLVVYRGMFTDKDNSSLKDPTEIQAQVRPLSSWSVDPGTAKAYTPPGAIFMRAEIPISQVLSTAFSGGMGTLVEREVVLLGPPEKIMGVVGSEHRKLTDPDSDAVGVIDVVSEEAAKERIEPGFTNWISSVEKLVDSAIGEYDEETGETTNSVVDPSRGNAIHAVFVEAAGFNGKPTLLSQEEFDAIEGETIYRAVSSAEQVTDFKESPVQYAGEGTYGNGTYASNNKRTTEMYAGDTGNDPAKIAAHTLTMKLLPTANVLSFEDHEALNSYANKLHRDFIQQYKDFGANPGQVHNIEFNLHNGSDWTALAIMSGVDAIRVQVSGSVADEVYTIILNRGQVAINEGP